MPSTLQLQCRIPNALRRELFKTSSHCLRDVVAMFAVALIAFAAVPLQALAQVIAGGTVGTELEPPRNSISEPELPALPELSDLPDPDL
jgi:hypothetical protein